MSPYSLLTGSLSPSTKHYLDNYLYAGHPAYSQNILSEAPFGIGTMYSAVSAVSLFDFASTIWYLYQRTSSCLMTSLCGNQTMRLSEKGASLSTISGFRNDSPS
jgi:hypothetical protein